LRRADHSSKESYRLHKNDYESEERGQGPTKGWRVIDEDNDDDDDVLIFVWKE
jgi:hypothetical protein